MKGLLFTYALTYGGAVIGLFNPFVGLLIYICFAIIKPESLWPWNVPQGNYSRIIAVSLLIGWGLRGFGDWRFGNARAIAAALVGYWLWSALSASQAPNPDVAWKFVGEQGKFVLPFLVGMTTIDSVTKLKQLAWVIALSQGYVAYEMNLSYFVEGFNRAKEVGFAGMEEGSLSISMVAGAGLTIHLALQATRFWEKALWFGLTISLVHVPMMSFSRGGMFGLITMALVAFAVIPKRPTHYVAFVLAVLLGLRLAGPEVRARFLTSFAAGGQRDDSAQSRLELWANCWDAMLKNPVFGLGPDHFPLIVHTYGWPPGKEAHTLWLQIGAELGFPGLVLLASFYGVCLIRLFLFMRESEAVPDSWVPCYCRMVVTSIVGFVVAAQFISLKGLELPFYITLLGAGVLKVSSDPGAWTPPPSSDPGSQHPTITPAYTGGKS